MMPIIILVKDDVMSDVEQRPTLIMSSYGWHRCQWVKLCGLREHPTPENPNPFYIWGVYGYFLELHSACILNFIRGKSHADRMI